MDALRLNHVLFCGENPGMFLLNPDTPESETGAASLSYWFCTYSPYGEGHVLFIQFDDANAALLDHPSVAIYSDNPALGRYLAETFTQYFGGWEDKNLPQLDVLPARFLKESDSRSFYRVGCQTDQQHIELSWSDMKDISLRTMSNTEMGSDSYHVVSVFFLCTQATITVNNKQAAGIPQTQIRDTGQFASSAFVALAETWVKVVPES